ncbi:hypothetical protein Agub_g3242 [Astrephomene gubernaculifera]|uniref:Uncharacterized protein n=1 Tax=Astrephomene gubernaculifera TaxID=47775 RepID=A0AAD3HIA0_9CHLO|nr:hypothetical protein Agub_g3242 [Astrephomene gubernaculifera]
MNSADDFRRSIEASLPPLTQYSVQTGAPGVYGAFGWGSMLAAGRQQEADSIRASRASYDASTGLRGSQEPDVSLSASLRNSFTQYPAVDVQGVRDSYQTQANSNGNSAPAFNSVMKQPVDNGVDLPRLPAVDRFPLAQQQTPAHLQHERPLTPTQQVASTPTAPVAYSSTPGIGMDGTVMVQATASPTKGLYPCVPCDPQQTVHATPCEDMGERYHLARVQGPPDSPVSVRTACTEPSAAHGEHGLPYPQQPYPQRPQPSPQAYHPRQQPFQMPPGQPGYGATGALQGKVVHMRRTEAWTKYIAYEGCLQVCMTERERNGNMNAQHFLAGAFSALRKDLGVDGLLLTQIMGTPPLAATGSDGGINDICWDDMEPTEKRLNTVAFANATASSHMRIRCQRLSLPSATVLQKLCGRARCHLVLSSLAGVTVHLTPNDESCDPASFVLDSQGAGVQQGQALVFQLDSQEQNASQCPATPQQVYIHVDGPKGPIATGSVPYRELVRLAMQQREPVDEARATSSSVGASLEVQVRGTGEHAGKVANVVIAVTRVRKDVQGYDMAQVASDGVGVESVNKNTLRTNACLAYDAALSAALSATGCNRHKLLVDGPWEWLLGNFASYFGVRSFYCTLAHLRWVLKPGVATISSMCLDVISSELKPLLEQSALKGLTTHESTLLEGVQKAVEMLLEVAFENYYALGDDQSREANGSETPRAQGATVWRPTVLMASFRLFRAMKDVFLPTDQDWLNTHFRVAAKKRWHYLEGSYGYEQLRDVPRAQQPQPPQQQRQPVASKLGPSTNTHDPYYKMAEKMSMAIRSDLEFDMFLQKLPDLLPSALNLPRITAEEYMANFVELLRNMLAKCPPLVPSPAAVDLLVATASLQRYLQETQLYMPHQHPGRLDAMELWRPHVLYWIDNSRRGLCGHCVRLETEAKLSAAHLARVDVAKMPGMIEGIEGAVAPLVHDMLDRTWAELMLYERVVKNWSLFGPHLEAALCDVLRTVQGSLNRICAGASNTAMTQQPGPMAAGGSPNTHTIAGHRRMPTAPSASPSMGFGGPATGMHGRNLSNLPYGAGGPGRGSPGVPMVPQYPGAGMAGGALLGGRNAVLLKEAVLLNSLKVLMVMVPSIEDIISKWCGGHSVAPPGPPHSNGLEGALDDDLATHIGAQFAMAVKELRTDYAEGVAACAERMANHIRATPATNIKAALNQPKPPTDMHVGYQQVSTVTQQRDFVEGLMRPILAACDEALQGLRAALDPRVFVATGRALWDCMGKDLFEFVHFLQESQDNKGAWRLRQHANIALTHLCEFFRSRLAASMEHCIGDRDLDLPINVDKAQKLLAQNTAVVNITLNPI